MDPDRVARLGFEGWKAGKTLVITGLRNRAGAFAVRFIPRAMARRIAKRLNAAQ
jgi:short-subunit dehydrogenase